MVRRLIIAALSSARCHSALWCSRILPGVILLLAGTIAPARAQERRVPVPVDYIAGSDVYIALGSRDGLAEGDTVPTYFGAAGEQRGMFLARVVTLRRTVLTFAGSRFALAAGDTLWLGLHRPPEQPPVAQQPTGTEQPPDSGQQADARPLGIAARRRRTARLDGRMTLDVDAIQTDAFESGGRRFTTPTFRFQAVASDLPGGVRLSTNLRASRRWASVGTIGSATSLRVYQASLEKSFTAVPLRLQAGRFSTPLEPYGGYWDGVLARAGDERIGVGAAVGFLPRRADEGFSSDVPRASAFADYHVRSGTLRYDAELGLHALRPRARFADQTFVGAAQRLRWRDLWLSQSIQIDRNAEAGWTVSALQLQAAVPLTSGLVAQAGGSRHRDVAVAGQAPLPTFHRDRASVGVAYYGARLSINADLAAIRRADGRTTHAYAGSLYLPHTVAGLGLGTSATLSNSDAFRTTYFSGELSRRVGPVHIRAGLRSTRFSGLLNATSSNGAEVALNIPLGGRTQVLIRTETWWGDAGGASQRVLTSLSTGF